MKDFAYERKSGADNIEDTDVWIARKGVAHSVVGDSRYTGWGISGRPGEPFNLTGLRSIRQAVPQTKVNSALTMVGNYEAKPNFGPVLDVYVTEVSRTISMTCGAAGSVPDSVDDCAFHDVKGIKTLKYMIESRLYNTTLDGVPSSSCRGTASAKHASSPATSSSGPSCDWLMRQDGVLNLEVARGAPAAASLGYFGHAQSGIREAVSITEVGSSDQIYFDEAKDGVSVFYEPITGAAIKGREYFQSNFYVEATLLDSIRYDNLFSADTDNEDSFVWPCAQLLIEPIAPARANRAPHCFFCVCADVFVRRNLEISDDGADSLKKGFQSAFTAGAALHILGYVSFVTCLIIAIGCVLTTWMRDRKKNPADASLELKSTPV